MRLIRRNIIANYLGQGWSGFMAVAFLPLYVQYLGVEAYGLIGLFVVFQALVAILDMGIGNTLNKEMASFAHGRHSVHAIRDLLRRLEKICYSLAVIILLTGWFFSDYLAREWLKAEHLVANEVAYALVLMTLVAALRLCEGLYRGALYGLEDQVWYNLTYSIISTLRYLGALGILMFFSDTIKAFFLWQAAVSIVTLIALTWRVHHSLPVPLDQAKAPKEPAIKVLKYAGGVMGITFLTMIFLQSDKVLLSRLVSLKELGYYSLAATAASVIFILVVPVTQGIFPQLVRFSSGNDPLKMAATYRKATKLVVVLTASASMLLYFFSAEVVYVWSGNPDLVKNSAPLLSILALGSFLNGLSHLPCQLLIAHGWTTLLLKINAIILLLYIPTMLIVVPPYGVQGAAWVWVATNVGYLLAMSFLMHARLLTDQKWNWYFFDVLLPTCGAVIVMILAKKIQPNLQVDRVHWLLFLMLTGVLAVLISAMFATFFKSADVTNMSENK